MSLKQILKLFSSKDASTKEEGILHFQTYLENPNIKGSEMILIIKFITARLSKKKVSDENLVECFLRAIGIILERDHDLLESHVSSLLTSLLPYFKMEKLNSLMFGLVSRVIQFYGPENALKMSNRYFYCKNPKVRFGILQVFLPILTYDIVNFPILTLLPKLGILLYDQTPQIKESVIGALSEIYSYVGDPLIKKLRKLIYPGLMRVVEKKS
eukprot:Anaeramoba_flamelloidesc20152_g1_i1.p1 GENE.c20152_g1_i1~~c20152_g1_i1.p1  ORF type:complete len:220 (-),score=33.98 c20152_g1_i1:10-648(-)